MPRDTRKMGGAHETLNMYYDLLLLLYYLHYDYLLFNHIILNKRILPRDARKMGGALETAPVVAPLRLGSRPILGHLCFRPPFE